MLSKRFKSHLIVVLLYGSLLFGLLLIAEGSWMLECKHKQNHYKAK